MYSEFALRSFVNFDYLDVCGTDAWRVRFSMKDVLVGCGTDNGMGVDPPVFAANETDDELDEDALLMFET